MTNNNQTKRIGDWQQLLMGIGFWILLSALLAQLALVFSENVLGVSLASLSNQNKLNEEEWWTLVLSGLFIPSLSFVLAPFGLSKIFRRSWLDELTLNRAPIKKQLLLSLLLFVLSSGAVGFLLQINQGLTLPEELSKMVQSLEAQSNRVYQMVLQKNQGFGTLLVIVFMAFFPALTEEVFFRGFAMKKLIGIGGNFHLGIWLSAAFFAIIHVQPLKFLPMLLLGAILGYVAYYSRSIWASVSIHFMNNTLAVLQNYFNKKEVLNIPDIEESVHINPLLAAVSFLAIFGILFLMNKAEKEIIYPENIHDYQSD